MQFWWHHSWNQKPPMVSQLKLKILNQNYDQTRISPVSSSHPLPHPPAPPVPPPFQHTGRPPRSSQSPPSTPLWWLGCSSSPPLRKILRLIQVYSSFGVQLKRQKNFSWPHILGQIPSMFPKHQILFFHRIFHWWNNNTFICANMYLILVFPTTSSTNSVIMTALFIAVSLKPSTVSGMEREAK